MHSTNFDCYFYTDKSSMEIEEILNKFKLPMKYMYIHCNNDVYKNYFHVYLSFGHCFVNTKYLSQCFGFDEECFIPIKPIKKISQFLFLDSAVKLYFDLFGKLLYSIKDIKKNF